MAELYALRALRRAPARAGQPPDGDGRLLGLGQGHGLRRHPVGAARRAGAARGAGGRGRASRSSSSTAAAARRRAAAGAPTARSCAQPEGTVQRPHPDHRAGRDGLRPLRRRGAGRAVAGADGVAPCCWPRALPNPPVRDEWREEMERLSRALARALPRAGLRRPGVPALLRPGRADRRALAAEHRLAAAVAQGRRRRRVAARDPVGVRVDAEPAAAAVLVRRGHGAGRGRPRAAARDVARLAVLPRADRDARDGALQDRPRRRRALPVARRRRHRASASGPTCVARVRAASSSAC